MDRGVRGRKVEYELVEGFNSLPNIRARHSDRREDQEEGWDVAVEICGLVTVKIDATISKRRFQEKRGSVEKQDNGVIPVLLSPKDTPRKMARKALRQIIATLPKSLVDKLLLSLCW